jgi:ABC-2 type transport system permease protein
LFWLFIMFLAAVITMRLIAEERRAGTLEPLQTAPISDGSIIVGKFLGALGFYASLWVPTLAYVLILEVLAPAGTAPDLGPVAAGYLGTLLVSASALALGLFFSTLTRNQILAAVLSFVTLAMLLLVGALGETLLHGTRWQPLFEYVDLFRHMEELGRGIVDSRRVIYHLSIVVVSLFAATRVLNWKRGR